MGIQKANKIKYAVLIVIILFWSIIGVIIIPKIVGSTIIQKELKEKFSYLANWKDGFSIASNLFISEDYFSASGDYSGPVYVYYDSENDQFSLNGRPLAEIKADDVKFIILYSKSVKSKSYNYQTGGNYWGDIQLEQINIFFYEVETGSIIGAKSFTANRPTQITQNASYKIDIEDEKINQFIESYLSIYYEQK